MPQSSGQTMVFFWYKFMLGFGYLGAWKKEIGNTQGGTRRTKNLPKSQCLNGYCEFKIKQARLGSQWVWSGRIEKKEIQCERKINFLTNRDVFFSLARRITYFILLTLPWLLWILAINLKDKVSNHTKCGVLSSIFYCNHDSQIC